LYLRLELPNFPLGARSKIVTAYPPVRLVGTG